MRRHLLSSSALGFVLAAALPGSASQAACSGTPDGTDNVIVCTPAVANGTVVDGLGGDDTFDLNPVSGDNLELGDGGAVTLIGDSGRDTFDFGNASGFQVIVGQSTGGEGTILGGDDDDVFQALDGVVIGWTGNGTLLGDGGDDRFDLRNAGLGVSFAGKGVVDGGEGNDTIAFGAGAGGGSSLSAYGEATVSGGEGNDSLVLSSTEVGGSFFNTPYSATVSGDAGDDTFFLTNSRLGQSSRGVGLGGGGNDLFVITDNSDIGFGAQGTLDAGSDHDTILMSDGSDIGASGFFGDGHGTVLGGQGNDTVALSSGSEVARASQGLIDGGEGDDLMTFAVQSHVGGGGNGTVLGGGGNDTVELSVFTALGNAGHGTLAAGSGDDLVTFRQGSDIGSLAGSSGTLLGESGSDRLFFHDDSNIGLAGQGSLLAGSGSDTVVLSSGSDLGDRAGGAGVALAGDGNDTIFLEDHSNVGAQGSGTLDGGGGADVIKLSGTSNIGAYTGSEGTLLGGGGNDTIELRGVAYIGKDGNGTLDAGSGDDTLAFSGASGLAESASGQGVLFAGEGADTVALSASVIAAAGKATLFGGAGDDLVSLASGSSVADRTGSEATLFGGSGGNAFLFDASDFALAGRATLVGGEASGSTVHFSSGAEAAALAGSEATIVGGDGGDTLALVDGASFGAAGKAVWLAGDDIGGAVADTFFASSASSVARDAGSTATLFGGTGGATFLVQDDSQLADAGKVTLYGDDSALWLLSGSEAAAATGSEMLAYGDGFGLFVINGASFAGAGKAAWSGGASADDVQVNAGGALAREAGSQATLAGGGGTLTILANGGILGDAGSVTLSSDDALVLRLTSAADIARQAGAEATAYGGSGADLLHLRSGSDFADGGTAVWFGGAAADTVVLSSGSSVARQTGAEATLFGGSASNSFLFDASDFVVAGTATLYGSDDGNLYVFTDGSAVAREAGSEATLVGGAGADYLELQGSSFAAGGKAVWFAGGDDTLPPDGGFYANAGSNVARDTGSEATLFGGQGFEVFSFDDSNLAAAGTATLDASEGSLEAYFWAGGVAASLAGSEATLFSGSHQNVMRVDGVGSAFAGAGKALYLGGSGAEFLYVENGGAIAAETGSEATLFAGGDDLLLYARDSGHIGQAGAVTLVGDTGDLVLVSSGSDVATATGAEVFLTGGNDLRVLDGSAFARGGKAVWQSGDRFSSVTLSLSSVAALSGSEATLVGNSATDTLTGSGSTFGAAGDASWYGAGGNDIVAFSGGGIGDSGAGTLDAGDGADRFALSGSELGVLASGRAVILGGAGSDTLFSSSVIGKAGQATLDLGADSDWFYQTGGGFGDAATGQGTLFGGDGGDTLELQAARLGGAGQGLVGGGSGADSLYLYGGTLGDLTGGGGTLDGGEGGDAFFIGAITLGAAGRGLISGGGGDDVAVFYGGQIGGTPGGDGTFEGGDGGDTLYTVGTAMGQSGSASLLGGSGEDAFYLQSASSLGSQSRVDLGADDDNLVLEDSTLLTDGAALDGGAGDFDRLSLLGDATGTITDAIDVVNFEVLAQSGSGLWLWGKNASFTLGAVTGGTFRLTDNATLAFSETFEIGSPGALQGGGTIAGDLRNLGVIQPGVPGDAPATVTVTGDYEGGGFLALDVTLGAGGDLLRIGGNATGSTVVALSFDGALEPAADTLLVEVAGDSDANAFVLAGGAIVTPRYTYDIELGADGNWYFVASPNNDTTEYALAGAAVLTAWQVGVGDLHRRLSDAGLALEQPQLAALGAGDAQEAVRAATSANPSGLWAQVAGESVSRDRSVGLAFDQLTTTMMAGFDLGTRGALAEGDLLLGGVFGSLISSQADVQGSGSSVELEGGGGGLYAAWRLGGFDLSAIVKLDSLTLDESIPVIGFTAEHSALALGGSVEAGWRLELGSDLWLRPAARLGYVKAWIDGFEDLGGEAVEYDDPDSLQGRLALSAGAEVTLVGARFRPYLEVAVTHEFLGEASATTAAVTDTLDLGGSGYELGGGVTVLDLAEHLELRIEGRYAAGEQGEGFQLGAGLRLTW